MRFEIRNEFLGPIPPCGLELRPLTVFTGGDAAGAGLLLRTIFYLSHLRSLMQILWERETEERSSVLEQPRALQNHLATQALMALLAGQNFDLRPGSVLRLEGTEVVLGAPVIIRALGEEIPSLFFPKERILVGLIASPVTRASMGLSLEVLHKSQLLLQQGGPSQLRLVELPELACDPTEQRSEVLRLAEWSNQGHRVILSTQEPLVLLTLNNLLQASLLPPREIRGMPGVSQRLGFARVAAFHLEAEAPPQRIVAEGIIREDLLNGARDGLEDQRKRILMWIQTLRDAGAQEAFNER